ncbi:MAG: DinB family protein [Vicinamibacterales bacterium]
MTATAGLVDGLSEAFDRRSWHGTNLRGAIRGLTAADAAWRPARGRHNIWEIVVHAAYWKYAVRRRLTGEPRGSFPLEGSDFWLRPDGEAVFRDDVALLAAQHRALVQAVEAFPASQWNRRARGAFTFAALVRGAAAHDLYHAGQIQLIKALRRTGRRT